MDTMKSLFLLWEAVVRSCDRTSEGTLLLSERDVTTMWRRAESEGVTVFTTYLPALASDLLLSFKTGQLDITSRWKRYKETSLPTFLHGYWSIIFADDGTFLPNSEEVEEVVHLLLTILSCMKKLAGGATPEWRESQIKQFSDNQLRLAELRDNLDLTPFEWEVVREAREILSAIYESCDFRAAVPRHGSGSVYDRSSNFEKHSYNRVLLEFERHRPGYAEKWEGSYLPNRIVKKASATRLTFVPKSADKDRMIGIEEIVAQEYQQGIKDIIYFAIEHDPSNPAYGRVNFTDQGINQSRVATSLEEGTGTLDLSSASDNVAVWHVNLLMPDRIKPFLFACRAPKAIYECDSFEITEKGKKKRVKKIYEILLETMVTMGNATCFTTMSTILFSLAEAMRRLRGSEPKVTVFGDDIILGIDIIPDLIQLFSKFGFIVNDKKSYWTGLFRESCGLDRYGSRDVTVPKFVHCNYTEANTPSKVGIGKRAASLHGFLTKFIEVLGESRGLPLARRVGELEGIFFPFVEHPDVVPLGLRCGDRETRILHARLYAPKISLGGIVRYQAPKDDSIGLSDVLPFQRNAVTPSCVEASSLKRYATVSEILPFPPLHPNMLGSRLDAILYHKWLTDNARPKDGHCWFGAHGTIRSLRHLPRFSRDEHFVDRQRYSGAVDTEGVDILLTDVRTRFCWTSFALH